MYDKTLVMQLPIEIVNEICSYGHPWEFRYYNRVNHFVISA